MFEKLSKSVTVTDLEGAAAGYSATSTRVCFAKQYRFVRAGGGIQEIRKCSGAERGRFMPLKVSIGGLTLFE